MLAAVPVLAGSGDGSISGVKFADLTGAGFAPSNVPQGGVTIQLYSDTNADGVKDAGDTLVATTVTATSTGAYSFTGLADGTYFVSEVVPTGATQTGGPSYYTVDILGGVAYSPTTTAIDNFANPSPAVNYFINAANPNPSVFNQASAGVLGGGRNVLINVLNAVPDPISAEGSIGAGVFDLGTDTTNPGTSATLQYDGTTSDVFVPTNSLSNAHGLSTDLTDAGAINGIRIGYNFLQGEGTSAINVTINATSAGGTASYSVNLAQNTNPFDTFAPFSSFTTTGTFTWTNITSLNVVYNAPALAGVDLQVNGIVAADQVSTGYNFANFAPPSTISGNVYVDVNDTGIITPTDPPIGNVEIVLTGTTDLGTNVMSTTFTSAAGTYSFTGLRPGSYTVTEIQPLNFIDGKTTAGTINGTTTGTASDNVIAAITLPADVSSISNNFGELGLTPAYVSKRLYLLPLPPVVLTAVNPVVEGGALQAFAAASSGSSGESSSGVSSSAPAIVVPVPTTPPLMTPVLTPAIVATSVASTPAATSTASPASSGVASASAVSANSVSASSSGLSLNSAPTTTTTTTPTTITTTTSSSTAAGATASAAVSATSLTADVKKLLLE